LVYQYLISNQIKGELNLKIWNLLMTSFTVFWLKSHSSVNYFSSTSEEKALPQRKSGVNFINILRANFLYERCFLELHVCRKSCRNDIHTKNLYVKCWWNWLKVSISLTFPNSFFIQKCFSRHLSNYNLAFASFLRKYIRAIAACNMLVKLSIEVVNFINILPKPFAPIYYKAKT